MPEYLDDPSQLTKDKLKSELLANNVELPSGNHAKDVYVQLYLRNLTAQNKNHFPAMTLDGFSSDEELPPPVVSSRSRSSGRKSSRKTDKAQPGELDVTLLTDDVLREELLKQGVDVGPIVASTRRLYEKKLQKLLDDDVPQPLTPQLVVPEIQVNQNGNSESDLYSDREDEMTAVPELEPVAEPEPVPVVERPVRSRGKTPVTTRTRSSQHKTRVPEDLPPVLTDLVELRAPVDRRLDRPARSEPLSTQLSSSAQEPESNMGLEVESTLEPLRTAVWSKILPEEHRRRPAARPSEPSSPLAHLTKIDPLTFSPMCNVSPIKTGDSLWDVPGSDQTGSEAGGGSAAGEDCGPSDTLLNKKRQQKITSFLSTCSPAKTHSGTSLLPRNLLATQVEKIAASDHVSKAENDVLKELFPNDINSPSGIHATCRRPIRGAAGRPAKSSDLWNDENYYFSPKTSINSSSSYTESRMVNRVSSLPPSTSSHFSSTSSKPLTTAPPVGQTTAARRGMSLWIKLFLLVIIAAFLFFIYQAMETNTINPFAASDTEVVGASTA